MKFWHCNPEFSAFGVCTWQARSLSAIRFDLLTLFKFENPPKGYKTNKQTGEGPARVNTAGHWSHLASSMSKRRTSSGERASMRLSSALLGTSFCACRSRSSSCHRRDVISGHQSSWFFVIHCSTGLCCTPCPPTISLPSITRACPLALPDFLEVQG